MDTNFTQHSTSQVAALPLRCCRLRRRRRQVPRLREARRRAAPETAEGAATGAASPSPRASETSAGPSPRASGTGGEARSRGPSERDVRRNERHGPAAVELEPKQASAAGRGEVRRRSSGFTKPSSVTGRYRSNRSGPVPICPVGQRYKFKI